MLQHAGSSPAFTNGGGATELSPVITIKRSAALKDIYGINIRWAISYLYLLSYLSIRLEIRGRLQRPGANRRTGGFQAWGNGATFRGRMVPLAPRNLESRSAT